MQWFYNMKIGAKLLASFVIILLMMIGLGLFSITQLSKVNNTATDLATNWLPTIKAIDKVKYDLAVVRISTLETVIADSASSRQDFEKALAANLNVLAKDQKTYETLITEPEERVAYDDFVKFKQDLLTQQDNAIKLAEQSKTDDALALMNGAAKKTYESMIDRTQKIVDVNQAGGDRADQLGNELYASARIWITGVLIVSVVVGLLLSVWLARLIANSLREAVSVARTVASGDRTSHIRVKSKDETGQLMQALRDMNQNLIQIVSEVRNGTDAIAASSKQIATGNLDLSSRTEEQASSLEETAASMEELTATVKQNSENARQANTFALAASEVANKGGTVVGQVVDTMAAIHTSSQKVSDIIGVIDGIAFQTNILALNAAVEAARAGEQGRGFAVVASEVRNLAQRSAGAAKEIKTLIDDSVGKVDEGSRLVNDAGTTMREVVDRVRQMTGIIGEISNASDEQTSGIEQVNTAVSQMDEVTQQNAALVEESAAASQAMQDQAARLAELVLRFKLDDDRMPDQSVAEPHFLQSEQPRRARAKAPLHLAAPVSEEYQEV